MQAPQRQCAGPGRAVRMEWKGADLTHFFQTQCYLATAARSFDPSWQLWQCLMACRALALAFAKHQPILVAVQQPWAIGCDGDLEVPLHHGACDFFARLKWFAVVTWSWFEASTGRIRLHHHQCWIRQDVGLYWDWQLSEACGAEDAERRVQQNSSSRCVVKAGSSDHSNVGALVKKKQQ
jgi:hypothetical protein